MPKTTSRKISITIPEAYHKFLKRRAKLRRDNNLSRVIQDSIFAEMQREELTKQKREAAK